MPLELTSVAIPLIITEIWEDLTNHEHNHFGHKILGQHLRKLLKFCAFQTHTGCNFESNSLFECTLIKNTC